MVPSPPPSRNHGQLDGALGPIKTSRESLTENAALEHTTIRLFGSIQAVLGKEIEKKKEIGKSKPTFNLQTVTLQHIIILFT